MLNLRHLWIFVFFISSGMHYAENAEFKNCDNNVPVLMYFTFPDPLVVILGKPINIIGGALVNETFPSEFQVKHVMKKRFGKEWWTLPCIGKLGTCINPMPCEMFLDFGFNGTCPIQPGDYKNYHLQIPTLKFPIPSWLTDGLYHIHIEGYDNNMEKLWFCGDLTQYFEQGKSSKQVIIN
ncbi:ganglioside GM2 activator-like [Hydractinia symbiolongicarpus]|uniref:ganglioside GM2 activator-like n=1 Tax=Hydractinia symbiolongicarpus TaxID=13093 RepID=UPI00254C4037|nr:ganglioside GM2 activator-like [Hydractinia symbiolongicarpus]